jgi:NAD(P)-dependent dehydrogenase (short-subunit alcohol dehydrogenase family)
VPEDFLRFRAGDVLVVTGGASGIGRATVMGAVALGLRVSAWDLDVKGLRGLEEELGGQVAGREVDISDPDAVATAFEQVGATLGPVGLLLNNAGPASTSDLGFTRGVAASLGALGSVTEAWLRHEGSAGGSLVNIASVAGTIVAAGKQSWYPAAKAGISGYTRWLSVNRPNGIRANAVLPGSTLTPRTAANLETDAGKAVTARNPMGRPAAPEDVAAAVLFLLSPAAAYINGVLMPVDGGMSNVQ